MAQERRPITRHSITVFGSGVLLVAMFAILWAVTPQIQDIKQDLTTRSSYEEHILEHKLSIRANDGNDRDPNWYSVSRQAIIDADPATLDARGRSIRKGIDLVCLMEASADSAEPQYAQSTWTEVADLERYGWINEEEEEYEDIVSEVQLEDAFLDLGISNDPQDWTQIISYHGRDSDVEGVSYPATRAQYKNDINQKDGVIIAENNLSPRYSARGTSPVVPLDRWSDVLWLGVQKLTGTFTQPGGTPKPVEHIFRFKLSNQETRRYLLGIAGKATVEDLGEWPGVTFPIEEYQALAALASANGIGVAFFLGQHKATMGLRAVDRVNLFNCPEKLADPFHPEEIDKEARMCMYFHVRQVEDS